MCFGLEPATLALIAGGIASAGGSVLQNRAQQKNAEARADARNAQLRQFQDKNERLSEEARAALEKRLAQEQVAPEDALGELGQERADETQTVLDRSSTSAPIPLGGNVPTVVNTEFENAQERTAGEASERANALARTRAFGDLLFGKGLATEEAGRDIGMVNSFAQANQRLLPIQQDLAEQSVANRGRGLGTIGSVLGSLGSLASTAGGSGVFGGAGSAAPGFSPIPRPRPVNLGL